MITVRSANPHLQFILIAEQECICCSVLLQENTATHLMEAFFQREHASLLSAICFFVSVSDNAASVISVPPYRYNANMPSSVHV